MPVFNERVERLREKAAASGLDALYIRSTSNIAWVTGFVGVFDSEAAHALIVTPKRAVLHTDSRYSVALRAAAQGCDLKVSEKRVTHAKQLVKALNKLPKKRGKLHVGIEDSLTLAEFRSLQGALGECDRKVRLKECSGFVEALRECKDAAEIAAMRNAQAITDAGFAHICDWMQEGMTEAQVQRELDRFMLEQGAQGLAFDTIVATGAHAASPHAQPGEQVLRAGDAVVMDFGAKWGGYCSDMTRTVFIGQPSDALAKAYDTLRRANETVEASLKAGVTGKAAHEMAEDILAQGGWPDAMGHALGHSVGLDVHESPILAPRNAEPLQPGNVVTVEPGIYIDGEFGMRLEDFGVVTDEGYEVLTQSTHDMVIIGGR